MKSDFHTKKVLITGISGFTGKYLKTYLLDKGFEVVGVTNNPEDQAPNLLYADITKREEIEEVIVTIAPHFIIHLAAISFVGHPTEIDFYNVNVLGTQNILSACLQLVEKPQKILLVSSATVYGNQKVDKLSESLCPNPVNHYGISKLAMELMAKNYKNELSIIITRPFNYTAPGQQEMFVIPKIAEVFKNKKETLELGNIDVYREYNSIDLLCDAYHKLMISDVVDQTVNISSNKAYSLREIISIFQTLTQHYPEVKINPKFVRKNEIERLTGCNEKLNKLVTIEANNSIELVLKSFLESEV